MAGTAMRSTQFRSIVEPILNQHFDGVYDQRTDEYKAVFTEENGIKRAYHEEVVLYGMGAAPVLPDGQAVTYDEGGELYVKRYTYDVYGLAFALTKVLVEDGDHIRMGSTMSKHLAQAMDETLETVTCNHLNRAFTSGYNGGDGVPLISASHPVIGGTQSNVLTAAALSQTSLEQALIQVRQAQDARGKRIRLTPKQLVIHPSNMLTAEVLLNSVLRTGTNNNDLNPVKSTGLLSKAVVLSRMTSPTAWFVQTDARDGLKVLWRRKLEKAMEGDFETDSVRYKATMRFGSGWTEWRSMYGNAGA
ncbi:MAG: Mu-like prophage major head subunit gpT family protein [Saprospiraceae bacterium]|nr:Mu-like prophage major head subunit gpT family protein [Saprospiraceae bacterium]